MKHLIFNLILQPDEEVVHQLTLASVAVRSFRGLIRLDATHQIILIQHPNQIYKKKKNISHKSPQSSH